jgi:uncharacterized protein (DUF362 family)
MPYPHEPDSRLTRRTWALAAASAALAACGRKPTPITDPRVSIVKAPAYDQSIYDTLRRQIALHTLDVRGKNVVLKPNLVEFDSATCINTHPLVVHAAMEAFRALGAASVRIAEGPGHRRITLDLADAAGYFKTIPNFESLFTDLNLDDTREVAIRSPVSKLSSVFLPVTALSADLLVSMPKMKVHHWVGATLSMKNMFGLVPGAIYGWPKNVLHWAGIPECIADIHTLLPPHFAIVDGIEGMEGNGPIQGTSKHAGILVAGADFRAVDATCCRIMQLAPDTIRYLQLSSPMPGLKIERLQLVAEPLLAVQSPFELIRELLQYRQP